MPGTVVLTRYKLGDAASTMLEVTNINDKAIAFKLKTTAPKLFVVEPSGGFILP